MDTVPTSDVNGQETAEDSQTGSHRPSATGRFHRPKAGWMWPTAGDRCFQGMINRPILEGKGQVLCNKHQRDRSIVPEHREFATSLIDKPEGFGIESNREVVAPRPPLSHDPRHPLQRLGQ